MTYQEKNNLIKSGKQLKINLEKEFIQISHKDRRQKPGREALYLLHKLSSVYKNHENNYLYMDTVLSLTLPAQSNLTNQYWASLRKEILPILHKFVKEGKDFSYFEYFIASLCRMIYC